MSSNRKSAWASQEGGDHYKNMPIQPMEYSMANGLDPLQHTAIKYISRFRGKGGVVDLQKAIHCIQMLIEYEEETRCEELNGPTIMYTKGPR